VTPVARPAPPATSAPDAGTGGKKTKEPLLSAALSLILPGAGQAYNGQMSKGLVLAAIYLGTVAIIIGGTVITALTSGQSGTETPAFCCCLPLFIVPVIVLIYAIYDAYNKAEKINNDKEVREWP
jgi:ABC-type transport system involved in cytochrome c biogenesis permease component